MGAGDIPCLGAHEVPIILEIYIMVRNEWFTLEENDGMKFSGTVVSKTFLGKTTRIKVKSDSSSSGMFCAEVETSKARELSAGKNVVFYAENIVIF